MIRYLTAHDVAQKINDLQSGASLHVDAYEVPLRWNWMAYGPGEKGFLSHVYAKIVSAPYGGVRVDARGYFHWTFTKMDCRREVLTPAERKAMGWPR